MNTSRRISCAIALTTVSLLNLNTGFAARMENIHDHSLHDIRKEHGPTIATLDAQSKARRHAEMLSLDADSSLTLLTSDKDRGKNFYRYQQTFRGIPVYGASIALSEDEDGNLRSMFGLVGKDLAKDLASTDAKLTPQQALTIAKRAAFGDGKQNTPMQDETSEKTIYIHDKGTPHVAYKTGFFSARPGPTAPGFIIDANTGEVHKRWEDLSH